MLRVGDVELQELRLRRGRRRHILHAPTGVNAHSAVDFHNLDRHTTGVGNTFSSCKNAISASDVRSSYCRTDGVGVSLAARAAKIARICSVDTKKCKAATTTAWKGLNSS